MGGAEAAASVGGSVIQAGATLLAGYWQNKANEKMNADNLKLAYLMRDDELAKQRREEAFNREQFGFNKDMARGDRSFRDREAAYEKRQNEYKRGIELLNNNTALRQNVLAAFNSVRRR